MQRYALWKADGLAPQTSRLKQISIELNISPLFETIYHIIGQRRATEQAVHSIMDHIMFADTTPLVLLFTGPSGHGKTELASRMGDLLSLDMLNVDCTEMKYETDMFGPKKPYHGYDEGSPLNNFLADKAGQRVVIFLDEIDKTSIEVRNAMLLLIESGFYKDRRNETPLDCSKIIWILAANLGRELIQKFWFKNLKDLSEDQQQKVSFTVFDDNLRKHVIGELGAPLTGRLSSIIPFMPFNPGEQAVATYKFMRDLWHLVRKPIDMAAKFFPGHLFISFIDDGSIAAHLARKNYCTETGARTLQRAVYREIRGPVAQKFRAVEELVTEASNEGPLPNYDVRLITLDDDVAEVSVTLQGVKNVAARV